MRDITPQYWVILEVDRPEEPDLQYMVLASWQSVRGVRVDQWQKSSVIWSVERLEDDIGEYILDDMVDLPPDNSSKYRIVTAHSLNVSKSISAYVCDINDYQYDAERMALPFETLKDRAAKRSIRVRYLDKSEFYSMYASEFTG